MSQLTYMLPFQQKKKGESVNANAPIKSRNVYPAHTLPMENDGQVRALYLDSYDKYKIAKLPYTCYCQLYDPLPLPFI